MMPQYDLEEERVRGFIKETRAKLVGIQLPAGLRPMLFTIEKTVIEAGSEPLVLADPCYGACDPADIKAKLAGCDALIHYGHTDMGIRTSIPTLYVEARIPLDPSEAVRKLAEKLKFKKVGLISTAQHAWALENVARALSETGIDAIVSTPGPRVRYPGQVLGCDLFCARSIADRVDGFLYIGSGAFHPIGCSLAAGKATFAINPISGVYTEFQGWQKEFVRKRAAIISRAAIGTRFGVVVSTKPGQNRLGLAREIVEKLRNAGKTAHLLIVDDVRPEGLNDFALDAIVCTACPRIAIDDSERFGCPVLTPFEAEVMLGGRSIEPYRLDEIGETGKRI